MQPRVPEPINAIQDMLICKNPIRNTSNPKQFIKQKSSNAEVSKYGLPKDHAFSFLRTKPAPSVFTPIAALAFGAGVLSTFTFFRTKPAPSI